MTRDEFSYHLSQKGINLTSFQLDQFDQFYHLLIEWNEKMNLTAITQQEEVYEKHFYDSLSLAFNQNLDNLALLDVGAGAGFPSIPLKIAFPTLKVTLLDSLAKRMTFIKEVIVKLSLKDVNLIINRAEDEGRINPESYDIVTARAVARLNILCELCLPLVKVNGLFIAMKGDKGLEELNEATKGITLLGGKVEKIEDLKLISQNDKRYNIIIRKVKPTPHIYPRSYANIKNKPL